MDAKLSSKLPHSFDWVEIRTVWWEVIKAKVKVEAPTVEEAVEILKGLRSKYEAHHKARLTDEALEAAVRLSDRYITGRFLPDKAIDVMDEACARARINSMTPLPDVKELESIRVKKESAIKALDFEKAAALRDSEKQTQDKRKPA